MAATRTGRKSGCRWRKRPRLEKRKRLYASLSGARSCAGENSALLCEECDHVFRDSWFSGALVSGGRAFLRLGDIGFGGLCPQHGVRCLQRLDLGLDLPLERASLLGEMGLAEDFEAIFPVDQVARTGAHPLLTLICFWVLRRDWAAPSSLECTSACLAYSGDSVWDGKVSCSAWRQRASAALTCIYPRATQPVSSAGRARENPLIPWFSGAAFHPARSLRRCRSASLPSGVRSARLPKTRAEKAAQLVRASERLGATCTPLAGRRHTLGGDTLWGILLAVQGR